MIINGLCLEQEQDPNYNDPRDLSIVPDKASGGYFDQVTPKNAHRVAMAALPLLFYFSVTSYPAFLIVSVLDVKGDSKRLVEILRKEDAGVKEVLGQMGKTAASVGVLALAVLAFPIAILASLTMGIVGDIADIAYYLIKEYDPEKAALSFVKLVSKTISLAAIILGGLELAVAAGAIGLGITIYLLSKEVLSDDPEKGRLIEGTGLSLQAILKTNSLNYKISRLVA